MFDSKPVNDSIKENFTEKKVKKWSEALDYL